MVAKRKLSTNPSSPPPKKVRLDEQSSPVQDAVRSMFAGAVRDVNIDLDEPEPEKSLNTPKPTPPPTLTNDRPKTTQTDHDDLETEKASARSEGSHGFLTAQGWHSINDPVNSKPFVRSSNNPAFDDDEDYEEYPLPSLEETYMYLGTVPGPSDDLSDRTQQTDSWNVSDAETEDEVDNEIQAEGEDKMDGMALYEATSNEANEEVGTYLIDDLDDENETIGGSATSQGEWEIINDDTCSPEVGIPAPHKLTILLRHKTTKVEKPHHFKKIKKEKIDWNNREDIRAISLWRRQILRRHQFPLRKASVLYEQDEEAYLLLMQEKIKAVAGGSANIKAPSKSLIGEAFNHFFVGKRIKDRKGKMLPPQGPRDESSLDSKLGRKATDLYNLREDIKKLLKGKTGGPVYVPIITDDELRQYRETKLIVIDDPTDPEKNATLAPSSGITGRRAQTSRNNKAESQSANTKDTNLTTGGQLSSTPKMTTSTSESVEALASSPESVARSESALDETSPVARYSNDSSESSEEIFTRFDSSNISKIRTTATPPPHTNAHIPNASVDFIPNLAPAKIHPVPPDVWVVGATKTVEKRLARNLYSADGFGVREQFWKDPKDIRRRNERDFDTNPVRNQNAAAANSLINAAIIPPVGYLGDVKQLVTEELLPPDQLALAKKSEEMLKKMNQSHDENWKKRHGEGNKRKRSADDDVSAIEKKRKTEEKETSPRTLRALERSRRRGP